MKGIMLMLVAALGLAGCVAGDDSGSVATDTGLDLADVREDLGNADASPDGGSDAEDGSPSEDMGRDTAPPPVDQGMDSADAPDEPDVPEPDPVTCVYTAPNGPEGYRQVDTFRGDTAQVRFDLAGLPDPATVSEVTLAYHGYDVDHPGAEGWIVVNGSDPIELPADEALDNLGRDFTVDVTGLTVAGDNRVVFRAFDTPDGSYYRISELTLTVTTRGPQECPGEPDPPTGDGVERIIYYKDPGAMFEQRRNWVLDCRDYAYSARFDEHRECDSRYNPDGSGHGRAIFTFNEVIADRYTVWIEGRHTENRNPNRMLAIVNGVERRINQRTDMGIVWDLHGEYELSGQVVVVIDSSTDTGSDSVRRVRITPVR